MLRSRLRSGMRWAAPAAAALVPMLWLAIAWAQRTAPSPQPVAQAYGRNVAQPPHVDESLTPMEIVALGPTRVHPLKGRAVQAAGMPTTLTKAMREADRKAGRRHYQDMCLPCHDVDAGGDGPMHDLFIPHPANLTLVKDSPAMLKSAVMEGVPGTAMPPHPGMGVDAFNQVVGYVGRMPLDAEYEWDWPWELEGKPVPPGTGKTIYVTACAGCHGPTGKGDGYWAANDDNIWPKPANFQARSSHPGRLYYIITHGREGTFMPPQQQFYPAMARWALAQYVASLYKDMTDAAIPTGNAGSMRNPYGANDAAAVKAGQQFFDLYCAPCHQAEANGTILAPKLSDRIWYFDGGTDTGVFTIVTKGVPGQLMPAHRPFPAEKRWQVIAYLRHRGGLPDPRTGERIKQSGRPQVVAQNLAFVPKTVAVDEGTTITWLNNDQSPHTVTSDGWDPNLPAAKQPQQWNSGPINPGHTYSRRFDRSGGYMYHCMIHPHMRGRVEVRLPHEQRGRER